MTDGVSSPAEEVVQTYVDRIEALRQGREALEKRYREELEQITSAEAKLGDELRKISEALEISIPVGILTSDAARPEAAPERSEEVPEEEPSNGYVTHPKGYTPKQLRERNGRLIRDWILDHGSKMEYFLVSDVCEGSGLKSTHDVKKHLEALEKLGTLIERMPDKKRRLKSIEAGKAGKPGAAWRYLDRVTDTAPLRPKGMDLEAPTVTDLRSARGAPVAGTGRKGASPRTNDPDVNRILDRAESVGWSIVRNGSDHIDAWPPAFVTRQFTPELKKKPSITISSTNSGSRHRFLRNVRSEFRKRGLDV